MDLTTRHGRSRSLGLLAGAVFAATLLVSGCSGGGSVSVGHAQQASSAGATYTTSSKAAGNAAAVPSKAASAAQKGCGERTTSARIYVRMILPGQAPIAQELGGERVWNKTTGKCMTSVQMIIAAAPEIAGSCTQVGYVADNPGYDANAAVAAPLKHVVAQSGPAC